MFPAPSETYRRRGKMEVKLQRTKMGQSVILGLAISYCAVCNHRRHYSIAMPRLWKTAG